MSEKARMTFFWITMCTLLLLTVLATFTRYIFWEDFSYNVVPIEQIELTD